jgi:uncharacterized protein YbcC (UPF0753/DUF2309 family)
MNTDLPQKVMDKIEAICTLGCTQVNQVLELDAANQESEEFSGFTESEKAQVIEELKKIMSIYDDDDC